MLKANNYFNLSNYYSNDMKNKRWIDLAKLTTKELLEYKVETPTEEWAIKNELKKRQIVSESKFIEYAKIHKKTI